MPQQKPVIVPVQLHPEQESYSVAYSAAVRARIYASIIPHLVKQKCL